MKCSCEGSGTDTKRKAIKKNAKKIPVKTQIKDKKPNEANNDVQLLNYEVINSVFDQNLKKDSSLEISSYQINIEYLMNALSRPSKIIEKYHTEALRSAKIVLYISISLFALSTIFLFGLLFFIAFFKNADFAQYTIPLFANSVTELLTGGLSVFSERTMNSKDKYFFAQLDSEEFNKVIAVVENMPDNNQKSETIRELVQIFEKIKNNK